MKTIFCGDIRDDEIVSWYKKITQRNQFLFGYDWYDHPVDTISTNNDHFLNGVRLSIKDGKRACSDFNIIFFPGKEKKLIEIKIDKNGHIDNWPDGFFDENEKALLKLI
jgi:hypothetical protein